MFYQGITKAEIINVSNRLPVKIGKKIEKSAGGLVAAFEDIRDHYNIKWVGWSGSVINDQEKRDVLCKQLESENCIPVFLTKKEVSEYYHLFSNSSLWPLLHYFIAYSSYEQDWFNTYQNVNQKFAEVVAEMAQENGIVWVHDFHLMLFPKILKEMRPDLKIGFFLHTPFPSCDVFRCHPSRNELLLGLLGADLIGFHTFGYLRHFRSTILRILGIDSEIDAIQHQDRKISIGVFPIGISWKSFDKTMHSAKYENCLKKYGKNYEGKKVVLSVERLDYTKGIPEKLQAIDRYLAAHPDMHEKVVFVLIAIPSREKVECNRAIEEQVVKQISYINGKYSTINNIPVQFIFKSIKKPDLCALYTIADVALVTPLYDGMNLVAKEYIACQKDKAGVLILSEFAGAAQELFNAIIINPYDTDIFVQRIHEAISLSQEDAQAMIKSMKENVIENSSENWARKFLESLTDVNIDSDFQITTDCLSTEDRHKLDRATNVVFFLDYDGTLREFENNPDTAYPTNEIFDILKRIKSKKGREIYIISGRCKEDLENWFSGFNCTLIAEHGFFWKYVKDEKWQSFKEQVDLSWKREILKILKHYALSTPGSFIEDKIASVVWHFRNSDPEFGESKARLLVDELSAMTAKMPIIVQHGKKIVEVCSQYINKGESLKYVLSNGSCDVIVCAGDDSTDEHMFQVGNSKVISIKIGKGETSAKYRFTTPSKFRNLLRELASTSG